jgi:hypothetical protein
MSDVSLKLVAEPASRCGSCGRSVVPGPAPSSSQRALTCECGAEILPEADATIQHAIDRFYLKLKSLKR